MNELRKAIEVRKQHHKDDTTKYFEDSRKRLLKIVSTKCRTGFIGALSQFEELFGYIWGHGKNELTDNQKKFKQLWEKARAKILDNGNNQIRAVEKEVEQYDIKWNRYSINQKFEECQNE